MKVSLKSFMPVTAAGILTLASCNTVPLDYRVKNYLLETNRLQSELQEVMKDKNPGAAQSKLDSIAYRDIFNSTTASKDSANVAEFNKIAARMRPDSYLNSSIYSHAKAIRDIDQKLTDNGISIKELDDIKAKNNNWLSDPVRTDIRQHYADDWAYRKFFNKIGIYNNEIAQKCDEISEKIRP